MTTTTDERHIPLAGTFNLRDVGGYATAGGARVRWRTLFRADSLHRLPAEAQEALLARGVRTVIDLRHAGELAVAPHILADAPGSPTSIDRSSATGGIWRARGMTWQHSTGRSSTGAARRSRRSSRCWPRPVPSRRSSTARRGRIAPG